MRGIAGLPGVTMELLGRLGWDLPTMAVHRQASLRQLLGFAQRRSAWHAPRLSEAPIDVTTIQTDQLGLLPVMTKRDVMDNWDQLVTDPSLRLDRALAHLEALDAGGPLLLDDSYAVMATGGSTGEPGVFCWSAPELVTWIASNTRWLLAAGGAPPARLVFVGARSRRHASAALPAFVYDRPLDELLVPLDQPLSSIVERLNALQPDGLLVHGSTVGLLAEAAAAGSLRIPLTRIVTGGDAVPPGAADAAEAAFGFRPIESYPTTDVGHIATSAPEGALCVNDDLLIVEPVDEADNPVEYGQCSHHLLVTSLYQKTLPLIRYRVEDRVAFQGPSDAHPAFSRITSIDGRSDDLFQFGRLTVHPHTFRTLLSAHPQISDYQVHQTRRGADVAVATTTAIDLDGLASALTDQLRRAGLPDPIVGVTAVKALPRTKVGKRVLFVPLAPSGQGGAATN